MLVTAAGVALRVASQAGVRAGLDRAAPADRVVLVSGNPDDGDALGHADAAVRRLLGSALAPAGVTVQRRTVSATYALRGGSERDRLVVGMYGGARDRARLTDGAWPAGDAQAALPRPAAEALGVGVGDRLVLEGQDDRPLALEVSGTWVPRDADDAFWAEDPLAVRGVDEDGGFRTLGPLLLADDPDGGLGTLVDPRVTWVGHPDLPALTGDELDTVGGRLDRFEEDGADDLADVLPSTQVVTRLDDVLRSLTPSLQAARTSVAVPTLLLLALAVTSLVLAGRVVSGARTPDVALRESRGFSRTQVLRGAFAEMLVIGLVVLVVGPWLAPPLVGAVLDAGDNAGDPAGLAARDWVWAAVTVLGGVVLLARAAAAGPRRTGPVTGWRRFLPQPRVVVEVLVVVLALVAWQQSAASSTTLLRAAAPTLVVLALLLLAARLLPLATRAAGGWVSRTRGTLGSVLGWQLTRRAEDQRSALVTTGLAAGVVVLLAGLLASWSASQDDQAAVTTAAGVRVTGLTPDQADTLAGQVGGTVVARRTAGIGASSGTVLAVTRQEAASVMSSPVGGDWASLLDRLGRPEGDAVPALVSRAVADGAGGERLSIGLADTTVQAQVVGVLDAFPASAPGEQVVLVDRDVLTERLGREAPPAVSTDDTEVWSAAAPDVVRREAPPSAVVLDRGSVAEDLRSGPVGTGLLTGSVLALVAAVMLGVLGSLSDTATALRARRRELASLRAQGFSRRNLVVSVGLERAALLVLATIVGGAAGWLVLRLFLDRLVLADSGVLPVPAPSATAPWLLLVGGIVAAVAVLVALAAASAARAASRPLGSDLRETT